MKLIRLMGKGLRILWGRLTEQGPVVTAQWIGDHAIRFITGAPTRRLSQITPQLHVGGQYRRRGWPKLAARGITAVINMRTEFDDAAAGIAPERYLHLPTTDDYPPSLEQLAEGAAFVAEEIAHGGAVYIHCAAGVGRAPTMAAAYLVTTGLTAEEAWARVRQGRPFVRPMAGQVAQMERFAAHVREGGT